MCVSLLTLQKQLRRWRGKLRRDTRPTSIPTMPTLLVRRMEKHVSCIRLLLLQPIFYQSIHQSCSLASPDKLANVNYSGSSQLIFNFQVILSTAQTRMSLGTIGSEWWLTSICMINKYKDWFPVDQSCWSFWNATFAFHRNKITLLYSRWADWQEVQLESLQ